MLIVFFRVLLIYALIIVSLRLMGKRQIGQLQPSELVVTILVSNIATMAIEDNNVPLVSGIIPIPVSYTHLAYRLAGSGCRSYPERYRLSFLKAADL